MARVRRSGSCRKSKTGRQECDDDAVVRTGENSSRVGGAEWLEERNMLHLLRMTDHVPVSEKPPYAKQREKPLTSIQRRGREKSRTSIQGPMALLGVSVLVRQV